MIIGGVVSVNLNRHLPAKPGKLQMHFYGLTIMQQIGIEGINGGVGSLKARKIELLAVTTSLCYNLNRRVPNQEVVCKSGWSPLFLHIWGLVSLVRNLDR
jgi:hypothetical protein